MYHYPGKWQGCMPKGCPPGIDKDNMLSPGDAFRKGAFAELIWLLTPGILRLQQCLIFGPGKWNLGPLQGHLRERKLSTLKFCTLRRRLQNYIMLLAISEIGELAIWFLLFWKHQVKLNSKRSAIYESNTRPRNLAMTPWWKVPSALCEQHHRFCVVDHCNQETTKSSLHTKMRLKWECQKAKIWVLPVWNLAPNKVTGVLS